MIYSHLPLVSRTKKYALCVWTHEHLFVGQQPLKLSHGLIVPEVEGTDHEPGFQHLADRDANNAVIVAPTHWGIGVCHNNTTFPPSRFLCIASCNLGQDIRVIYAAVKRCVVVYRRYGEAVVGLRRQAHLLGLRLTRSESSSQARYVVDEVDVSRP